MAITNPVAIKFCNEKARLMADHLAKSYNLAKLILAEWNALGGAALVPNTSAVVQDSASPNGTDTAGGDGRPGITGAMVNNIINRLSEQITDFEVGSNAKLNTVLQVAVNITPPG